MTRDTNVTGVTPPRRLSAAAWVGARSLGSAAFVPGTDEVSFVVRGPFGSSMAVATAGGSPEVHLALDPGISGPYFWNAAGTELIYRAADGCMYRFERDSASCERVTDDLGDASGLALSPGGRILAYCQDMARVVCTSLEPGAAKDTFEGGDFVADPAWSPDGRTLAWVEWSVPNMAWDESSLMVHDVQAGSTRRVAGGDGVSVQQPRFSRDGSRLGFLCDATGWMNVWSVDTATYGNARVLFEDTHEHGGPLWGSGSRTWDWLDDDVVVCRIENGRPVVVNRSGSISVGASSVVAGRAALLVSLAGSRTASSIAVVEPQGSVKRVARATSEHVELHGVDPVDIDWSNDGETVHGRLYEASNPEGPAPLLVWLHGGPTGQSLATLHHRLGYFVERGWSLLAVDYRGSTGWGRAYQQAMRNKWGLVDVSDTIAGVESVVARGRVDPDRIVLWGGSAGGFTGLSAIAERPDLFAGGVFMYPVSELADMDSTHRLEAHYNETLVGPRETSNEAYVDRSISARVGSIRGPILVLHGDGDEVVPLRSSEQLVKLLESQGTDVELHVYEGEGHGWRSNATRVDELERIEEFLNNKVLQQKGTVR